MCENDLIPCCSQQVGKQRLGQGVGVSWQNRKGRDLSRVLSEVGLPGPGRAGAQTARTGPVLRRTQLVGPLTQAQSQ